MILDIIRKHNKTGVMITPAFRNFIRAGIDAGNIHTEIGIDDVSDNLETTLVNLYCKRATYNKSKTRLWGDPETMADMVEDFEWHLEEKAEERRVAKESGIYMSEEEALEYI